MSDTPIDLHALLSQLFRAHGVEAQVDGDWVALPFPHARIQAQVMDEMPHATCVMVRVDVRAFVHFGRVIYEAFVGFGQTREEAVRNAMEAFAAGILHVLLAAFYGGDGKGQVSHEEWIVNGTKYRLTIGNAVVRGIGHGPATLSSDWWKVFEQQVKASRLSKRTHWIRGYFARDGSGSPTVEVLLDNDEWRPVQRAMSEYAWPVSDGFSSVRVFLAMQSGVDVGKLAGVMLDYGDQPIERQAMEMQRLGLSPGEAELAVLFIPLAFGRVMLEHMNVRGSHLVTVKTEDGKLRRIRLESVPIFEQASAFVREAVNHSTITKEEWTTLTMCSSEMRVLNEALFAGSKLENLLLSAPIMSLSSAALAELPIAGSTPATHEVPEMASDSPSTPRRKWWKLW